MTTPLLELRGISRHFGSLKAVEDVSFSVTSGSRHAVIGPNGAGKSTLFALIAGTHAATTGSVLLNGDDVTGVAEHQRVGRGLARTFQHSSLFLTATVAENIMLAAQRRAGRTSWSMFRPAAKQTNLLEEGRELLDRVGLADRSSDRAGALSHGERRQLEVAVALACRPQLLLLDEPAAGMSASETARLMGLIKDLPSEVTVMIVEHDLDLVFGVADTMTVLHLGHHLVSGSPAEVRASPEVQSAYLGAENTSELFPDDPSKPLPKVQP